MQNSSMQLRRNCFRIKSRELHDCKGRENPALFNVHNKKLDIYRVMMYNINITDLLCEEELIYDYDKRNI